MASDPKIVALQTVLNRYPSTIQAFAPNGLAPDGILGDKTATALIKALQWVAGNIGEAAATANSLVGKLMTPSGGFNFLQIRQSVDGLTAYLNDRADDAKMALAQVKVTPAVKTAPASDPTQILDHNKESKIVAATKQATQGLPSWAAYAGGIVLVVGTIAGVVAVNKRRKSGSGRSSSQALSPAVAGWAFGNGASLARQRAR